MNLKQLNKLYKELNSIAYKSFKEDEIKSHFKYFKDYEITHDNNILIFTKNNVRIECKIYLANSFIVIGWDVVI